MANHEEKDIVKDFLLTEFKNVMDLQNQQKEAGEKRLNFLITFTISIGTILIAAKQFVSAEQIFWPVIIGISFILLIGLISFKKMINRRIANMIYRRRIRRIRKWFAKNYPVIISAMAYDVNQNITMNWGKYKFGTIAFSVALIVLFTTLSLVMFVLISFWGMSNIVPIIPIVILCGVVTWSILLIWKNKLIRVAEIKDNQDLEMIDQMENSFNQKTNTKGLLPSNTFRANVGAIIINKIGEVLALERSDVQGAWQLPQGGLLENEEPIDALFREIFEETGINRYQLKILDQYPEWLAYEIPQEKRSTKYGLGQVQKWYLLQVADELDNIELKNAKDKEFSSWKWTTLKNLSKETISFRRHIYDKLLIFFSNYLKD